MIELEIMVAFIVALLFTALYLVTSFIGFGFLASFGWIILGFMWLFIDPMSTGYTFALLLQGIGFVFLLINFYQIFKFFEQRKKAGIEEDDLP